MIKQEHIGIEFVFLKKYINHFAMLFENISLEKYTWYVSCSENYSSCKGKVDLFLPDGIYSGAEFRKIINSISTYYVRLLRLIAVPNGKKFESENINYYKDYIQSNAEIVLLSADSYASFYAKDIKIINLVAESCKKNFSCDIEFLTEENDERTGFWV